MSLHKSFGHKSCLATFHVPSEVTFNLVDCNIPKIHQVNHALNLFLSLSSTQTLTLTSRKPSCSDLPIPGDLTRHPISIHVSSPSHPTRRVVTSRRESRPSFFPLPSVRVPHLPRPQSPLARTAPLLPLSFPSLSHFLFL